jgi:hypothetical protein
MKLQYSSHQCRYGFFTTYEETYFLLREDSYHFRASKRVVATTLGMCLLAMPLLMKGQSSSPVAPSLRKYFLFLGITSP